MRARRTMRRIGIMLLALALAGVLGLTFRAYLSPLATARWLALLSLCR